MEAIPSRFCYNLPMKRLLPALAAGLVLAGCLGENPEELSRLVKEDPIFKQMITARDEAQRQVQAIQQDLLTKKKIADEQIGKLRGEYDIYSKTQSQKIEQFRATIEANRSRLKQGVGFAVTALQEKTAELASYQRTLADVKKVLSEGKGLALSKIERQKWEERILLLSEKMRPLTEEIQDLRLRIRLKRQKIGYLR